MLKKTILTVIILLLAISAHADRRKYIWTYQTTTMSPGDAEFEFYQTTKVNEGAPDKWEYYIEVEQGISPKFDFSFYQIFTQTQGESVKWDAFQVRTRYRFGLPGEIAFDPVLYIEYRRKINNSPGRNKFETKLLVGKDIEKINISANPVFEYLWASGYDSYKEVGLDAAISYAPTYKFSIGLESTSRQYYYSDDLLDDKFKSSFGPTVSFASGDNYYSLGVAFGLNDNADDTMIRFLMGIGI